MGVATTLPATEVITLAAQVHPTAADIIEIPAAITDTVFTGLLAFTGPEEDINNTQNPQVAVSGC